MQVELKQLSETHKVSNGPAMSSQPCITTSNSHRGKYTYAWCGDQSGAIKHGNTARGMLLYSSAAALGEMLTSMVPICPAVVTPMSPPKATAGARQAKNRKNVAESVCSITMASY